jgi:hypothetical protein
MAKTKLTEAHKDQCRSMFKEDGKRPCEIIEFFKKTYNIDLKSPTLSYILHGKKKVGVASREIARRKKANDKYYRKKAGQGKETTQQTETEKSEFVMHVHAAFDIHKKDFINRVERALAIV